MPDRIVEGLTSHLAVPVNTSPAVVYLMAEVRKLVDRDRTTTDPAFALRMYCNWALHTNLDRPSTTQEFLGLVDRFILKNVSPAGSPEWPAEYKDDDTFSFIDEHRLFRDFVYLDKLRAQLKQLLASYGLPTELCDDNGVWFGFIKVLAGVIAEGELSIKTSSAARLKAVSKVVFRKGGRPLGKNPHVPFVIQWDIHLQDSRIAQTTVEADAEKPILSFGIHLIGKSKYRPVPT